MKPSSKKRYSSGFKTGKSPATAGIQLFRRSLGEETEFITVMWFNSLDAVRQFAGEDYEAAVVPPKARQVLKRFDARSQHYEVRAEMKP